MLAVASRVRLRTCFFALLLLLSSEGVGAETRRAVIVGINRYAVNSRTDRTIDLDGAVNDAQAMVETLRTYHGFQPAELHLLLDKDATREGILNAIQQHLIEAAQPGDISFFFFAGHGSYRDNPRSKELDKRDETIVPADTNRGVPDIRDKELARLFNQALDRQVQVVAIFDSCYSGSLPRGISGEAKIRFVPAAAADPRIEDEPFGALPEDRGALILAAAQDQQPAQEKYVQGQPRGRFSSSLQQILNTTSPGEAVESLFLRLRALMQSGGSLQEPMLAATKERRHMTLWNSRTEQRAALPRVAVGRVTASVVLLQAGFAIGLGRNAELVSVGTTKPVDLLITEVSGPATSQARVRRGDLGSVKPGDLFEIATFGAPWLEPLRVFYPIDSPPRLELNRLLRTLAPLRKMPWLTWIADPTVTTPTHTMLFRDGKWVVRSARQSELGLGAQPTLKQLMRHLHGEGHQPIRFFLNIPLPTEQEALLKFGAAGSNRSVERAATAAQADYLLIGRAPNGKLEFAWVLPDMDESRRSGLPTRSDWLPIADSFFEASLSDAALRLSRHKAWQTLYTPAGRSRFPYHLQIQNMQTQEFLPPETPVRAGEAYRPVLMSPEPPPQVQPRYVYLFALDKNGGSTLLVPGNGMAVGENLVPDARNSGPLPTLIPIGTGFAVRPPYGTDTLVLLTSATALPDPSILLIEPFYRGQKAQKRCAQPLECLIFGINEENTRNLAIPPVDWSVERIVMKSIER